MIMGVLSFRCNAHLTSASIVSGERLKENSYGQSRAHAVDSAGKGIVRFAPRIAHYKCRQLRMKAVEKARRQGRSERGGEAYFELYVEPPSERERSLRAFSTA